MDLPIIGTMEKFNDIADAFPKELNGNSRFNPDCVFKIAFWQL